MNKEIDKEKFMEFVSQAFDMGANIGISFYRDTNEESAKNLAAEFAQIIDANVEEVYGTEYKTRWYKVDKKHSLTAWHNNSHDKKILRKKLEELLKDEEVQA